MDLSFSARDLITLLVREDGSIRGKIADSMWLHRTGCPDRAVALSDVGELLLGGLIVSRKLGLVDSEELYRPSAAGNNLAGTKAIADAERSATQY